MTPQGTLLNSKLIRQLSPGSDDFDIIQRTILFPLEFQTFLILTSP